MIARFPAALTIAGSDSSGGAGIQADLKTFAALGVYGASAITAVTAQNTRAVTAIFELPVDVIAAQIDAVANDLTLAATKTGMLASAEIIELVAAKVRQHDLRPLVVDPVMVAKSGDRLLREDAVDALRRRLLPLAAVLTPNLPEAGVLLGHPVATWDEMRDAAAEFIAMGAQAVVVKGGHREGPATDVFYDGAEYHEFTASRVDTTSTHGTGCTFASAIATFLAHGESVPDAVGHAKEYLTEALRRAYPVGHGHGPVNHFWKWWE